MTYIDPLLSQAMERIANGAALLVERLDPNEHILSADKAVLRSLFLDAAEAAAMLDAHSRVAS